MDSLTRWRAGYGTLLATVGAGLTLTALSWLAGCSSAGEPPRATAVARDPLTGMKAPAFVRYWAPFARTGAFGAYTSVTVRDGMLEFWHAVQVDGRLPDDQSANVNALAVQRGRSLSELGPSEVVLVMRDLVNDVPRLDGQPGQAPGRAFTRTFITYDPEAGYVGLVCSHPEYRGHYLHPALIVSKTGKAGDWTYQGKLTGEPAEEAAKRRVWSDGGGIFRLPGGRWRIYANGYGDSNGVIAMEADTLAGPWSFVRKDGKIRMLTPHIPSAGGQNVGPFPNVLRVSDREWHLWISDRWMPDAIWHFVSTDGLEWGLYGRQPEIVRLEGEDNIKCLRTFLAPDGRSIVGMLSVMVKRADDDGGAPWAVFESRLPVGPAEVK